jgi:arsenite methyltransferase
MTTLQVFDRPMCCSSGVCGPKVDPILPRFAADLEWLKGKGVQVERYNLAQEPQAFTAHDDVTEEIARRGMKVLPIVRVDGRIVSRGTHPTRAALAGWAGVNEATELPVASSCCGGEGCC